jgi:hypothetical protein
MSEIRKWVEAIGLGQYAGRRSIAEKGCIVEMRKAPDIGSTWLQSIEEKALAQSSRKEMAHRVCITLGLCYQLFGQGAVRPLKHDNFSKSIIYGLKLSIADLLDHANTSPFCGCVRHE